MTKVLGIDLGTSSSAAAVFSDGEIRIIPSFDGKNTTRKPFPSVVSFLESGKILVGAQAIEQSLYNPKGSIFNSKRKIGTREPFNVFGKEYLPEFIESLILAKIKSDAEDFIKEKITKVVITVPAYFNDNQRQATKTAGEIAGLDVVRIMTEPVAAAVSYGLGKIKEQTKVLVFDMGAGTLDVSILEIDDGFFEVIGTGGDMYLGGIDMDKELDNYFLDEYKKQNGSNVVIDETVTLQINRLAEKIKIELTENEQVIIDEAFFSNGIQTGLKLKITQQHFEELIQEPILKRCEQCLYNVLNDLKLSPDKIQKVILVGGPTRIPAIRKMISKILREPETGVDPEFSVARGAAIEGAVLANDENLPVLYQGLTLLNVTPLDLGEKAVMKNGEIGIKLMIPKNTTYPTEITQTFYRMFPVSPKVEVSVWQGDVVNHPYDFLINENLGNFFLYVPKRENLEIEITYKIDANGILTVSAVETSTGNRDQLVIEKIGGTIIPKPQLDYIIKENTKFEEEYKKTIHDVLSPYEIPVRQASTQPSKYQWMCTCLHDAKSIIRAYHGDEWREFLSVSKFTLFIQQDKQYVFGHIQLGGHPYYPIGIHNALKEDTSRNRRMLIVILIHELLHAIHPDWGHDRIRPAERVLAMRGNLFDAVHELDILFLSGKMSFCNNVMDASDESVRVNCED